jgi:hypothetical protein
MKLRIKNDSVRFRVPPSEVRFLIHEGRLTSQVGFPSRQLLYSLVLDDQIDEVSIDLVGDEIIARLPKEQAVRWATTDLVGLGQDLDVNTSASLTLLVEKDFACLDKSDEENLDTYPNPNIGQVC